MLPLKEAQDSVLADDRPQASAREPWIPKTLRKSRAIPLALYCWLFAASLQAMSVAFNRNGGLAADGSQKYSIWAAKYLPTVGVVVLSFLWKGVTSDLKKITPWASLSGGQWKKASESILLDYTTRMELLSVLDAARCRHFALILALLVGFVCGAMAPLANAMTSEAFSTRIEPADLVINSTFDFNGTLTHPNGSIIVPPALSRYKPYAAVINSRSVGGTHTPWTTDSSAFESFSHSPTDAVAETLMEAGVQTFSTQFDCVPLQYTTAQDGSPQNLAAFVGSHSNSKFNCSLPIHQNLTVWYSPDQLHNSTSDVVRAWLNLSSCSDADPSKLFITATVAFVNALDGPLDPFEVDKDIFFIPSVVKNISGLICAVDFSVQNANVTVEGSTGQVKSYSFGNLSRTTRVDANLTTAGLLVYLDALMFYFDGPESSHEYLSNSSAVAHAISTMSNILDMGFFFGTLTDSDPENLKKYMNDPRQFQTDVEALGSSILTQVINFQARRNSSMPATGNIQVVERHLVLHRGVVSALQVSLALIGCAVLLLSTILRPRCLLLDDPGRFAAGAFVLSKSEINLQRLLEHESLQSAQSMRRDLDSLEWKLTPTPEGDTRLQFRRISGSHELSSFTQETSENLGWRPLPLQFKSKALISTMLLGTFLSLAALLIYSRIKDGITQNRPSMQYIFHFVSTAILVILGYVCSGIDSAVSQVTPYRNLQTLFRKGKRVSNVKYITGITATFQHRIAQTGLSRMVSTTAVLLLPILKVMASGLYSLIPIETARPIQPWIDSSLVTQSASFWSESTANRSDSSLSIIFRAWLMTYITSVSFNARPGYLDDLLLSDITHDLFDEATADLGNVKINARVPALLIDVSVEIQDAQFYVSHISHKGECWYMGVQNCQDMLGPKVGPSSICSEGRERYYVQSDIVGGIFTLCLADLSGFPGLVGNTTPIALDKTLGTGDLNVSFPQVTAIRSWLNLTKVHVNATYARTSEKTWTPIEYDRSTIDTLDLNDEHQVLGLNNYTALLLISDMEGDTLWPNDDQLGIFPLLALYAETHLQNLTALLDGDQLAQAVKNTIIAYCAELFTEYRTIAQKQAKLENVEPQKMDAMLLFNEERIVQNVSTTIILEVLLAAIFFSYIWIFYRFSSRPILPKSPGSIAAQLSFIADSDLVRSLREDTTMRLTDDEIWDKAALGWWKREVAPQDAERGEGEETDSENDPPQPPPLRWGIDIGEPFSRQRWNKPPSFAQESENEDGHESQNEEAQNDGMSRLVDLQSQIELQKLPNRRESETQSDEQQQQQENTQAASEDGSNTTKLGLDLGNTQSVNLLLAEPRFNDAASEDQRSEYSVVGNEHSEAQSVTDSISQPLLRPKSR